MATQITKGIKISVTTLYNEQSSNAENSHHLFTYMITIENNSDHTVRLLRRHWSIFDSCGEYAEVEGDGVVGIQPIIEPGDAYEYSSYCNLKTELGKMFGEYVMERLDDRNQFTVEIPEFYLEAPHKLN
jgi:ApaG protein